MRGDGNWGRVYSSETKKKISESVKLAYKEGRIVQPLLGKKHSPESIEKMRQAKLGKKASKETREKMSLASKGKPKLWAKGRKFSEETKRKLSLAHKGVLRGFKHSEKSKRNMSKAMMGKYTGKLNPNWKGGVTSVYIKIRTSEEYKLWRLGVFKRDYYTCRLCDKKGGDIVAHHIVSFKEFSDYRLKIGNGMTLCLKCHRKLHSKGGWEWTYQILRKKSEAQYKKRLNNIPVTQTMPHV